MGRTARNKRDLPHPPPVERIELNEEHTRRRLIAAVVLLVFGAAMLAYAFMQLMSDDEEWTTISVSSSVGASCGEDFVLLYRPGAGGMSPTAERKGVSTLYTQLCRSAFEQFHNVEIFEGVNNISVINRRPNEVLEVDPGLYEAFAVMVRSGSRALYLGPVYERYEGLFYCQDDSLLADFDPQLSPEVAQEYLDYAAFANDPESIGLELLGENKIRLSVSEEYLAYGEREGITDYIEFGWTRNAFIADYIANGLTAQGYTNGVLTSYDGFVRNLDGGADFSQQVYDRQGQLFYPAATMYYRGPRSIVSLRDYPVNDRDRERFYELRSGETRTPYLDTVDGVCKSSVHNLVCYAAGKGCGEILLAMMPIYIADVFQPEALEALAAEGIHSIRCEGSVIYPTDPQLRLEELYQGENVQYTIAGN